MPGVVALARQAQILAALGGWTPPGPPWPTPTGG